MCMLRVCHARACVLRSMECRNGPPCRPARQHDLVPRRLAQHGVEGLLQISRGLGVGEDASHHAEEAALGGGQRRYLGAGCTVTRARSSS